MPVERGPKIDLRSAIILGVSGVLMACLIGAFVLWLSGTGGVDVQLGDDEFENLHTKDMAEEIADGGPLLFSDVGGGTRDIYVNHLADAFDEGWVAFAAHQPGADRECFLEWKADREVFVDPCDGTEFGPDGAGLPQYATYLEDDGERLVVDINGVRSSTTTSPATTPA
jgi:hypothetical protein